MKLTDYDLSHPYQATVIKSERITDEATDEVRNIILEVNDARFHHFEGQSVAVLVPGPHDFGNPHHVRLYSIASTRHGEGGALAQFSLCVRRCFYIDEVNGERYPGVASNYLCDRQPGELIQLTGPYGRQFQAPRDENSNILMIGVGTGIAPFRAFVKHIYDDRGDWKGQVRLFYGARTGMDLLYMNDRNNDFSNYYDEKTFKAFEALSPRPHFDEPAQIERSVKENAEEVWSLLQDDKTYVYISGLSKLEDTMDMAFADLAGSRQDWEAKKDTMIQEGRWSTLMYD